MKFHSIYSNKIMSIIILHTDILLILYIAEGVPEASQIFLRDAHVLTKLFRYYILQTSDSQTLRLSNCRIIILT
jgi:hypothetical protein